MTVGFMRRSTNNPTGIAAGGGDTDFDIAPQKTQFLKRVSQAANLDCVLPKGTVILATIVKPDPDMPALAGTVKVESWDLAGNASIAVFVTGVDATIYSETGPATTANDGTDLPSHVNAITRKGTILTVDTRFKITPTGIGVDTAALAGFEVILPRMRG